jgi:hypothetical protein
MATMLLMAGAALGPARADWRVLKDDAPGPVRGVTRGADGAWLGARLGGGGVEVLIGSADAETWRRRGVVTSNDALAFGDPMLLAIPGTRKVFCAFRTRSKEAWRVLVYRSDNDGRDWAYDSTVAGPSARFVGAPFLFVADNGDLQCYYDSEPLAANGGYPGFQWIAMRGRRGIGGAWNHYGLVTASRENDPSVLARDGMPTVVSLGDGRLLCVTEGVKPGHGNANVVRAIESRDGGRTWDYPSRRILYECRVDPATELRYNAYAPYALRAADGSVWVAFCTDEDEAGPPDASHEAVHIRRSRVKVIHAANPPANWSVPDVVWSQDTSNYIPALFERGPGELLATVHLFNGRDAILSNRMVGDPPRRR